MTFTKKSSQFLSEILKIFWLIPWYLCLGLSVVWLGLWAFSEIMMDLNPPPLSLLFKKNKKYGHTKFSTYTKTEPTDVLDTNGCKVGSLESKGETVTYEEEDNRKYVPRYVCLFFYMLYFPLSRIIAIFVSFVALFTDKFYVSTKIPDDYKEHPYKYKQGLFTFFNIISARTPEEERKYKKEVERENARIEKEQKKYAKFKEDNKEIFILLRKFAIITAIVILVLIICYYSQR